MRGIYSHFLKIEHMWFLIVSYKDLKIWFRAIGIGFRRYTILKRKSFCVLGFRPDEDTSLWQKKFTMWGAVVGHHQNRANAKAAKPTKKYRMPGRLQPRSEQKNCDEIPESWEQLAGLVKRYGDDDELA